MKQAYTVGGTLSSSIVICTIILTYCVQEAFSHTTTEIAAETIMFTYKYRRTHIIIFILGNFTRQRRH